MTKIAIPYGRTVLTAEIDDDNLLGVFRAKLPEAAADEAAKVARALDHPVGSAKLEDLAVGKRNAVIISSDHTRPVPSRIIMPQLLARLRKHNPGIDITILIATGAHRLTTDAELREKFGDELFDREKIVVHDSTDEANLRAIGILPSGGKLILNKIALETDLLIAEGFIEPHFFAGFSGGRKSVLPGVASLKTVMANHCSKFIADPAARLGNLSGNPIHCDMVFAARKANLAFIVNAVIDQDKKIVEIFAGDCEQAHEKGCEYLKKLAEVPIPEADIAITGNGGYPLDQNLYQAVKCMNAAEMVLRPGGVIIAAACCNDGHGGEEFFRSMKETPSPAALLQKILTVPQDQTEADQWQYQILCRILANYRVIVVTRDFGHELLRQMHFGAASSIEEALQQARQITGADAKIAVIPDGVSLIPIKI